MSRGRLAKIEVSYAGSAAAEREYPGWALAEIAVAGRSNAGKSSLLNQILGRRGMARVSGTPGRTQRLHFYSCSFPAGEFALVDLPGYGYARAPKQERRRWGESVEDYLLARPNLRALLVLVDVRRGPEAEERMLEDLAADRRLGMIRVATKIDKLGRAERTRRLAACGPSWIPFSAQTGEGREAVLAALAASLEGNRS